AARVSPVAVPHPHAATAPLLTATTVASAFQLARLETVGGGGGTLSGGDGSVGAWRSQPAASRMEAKRADETTRLILLLPNSVDATSCRCALQGFRNCNALAVQS